jgi:NAD(P) transhydrogenase
VLASNERFIWEMRGKTLRETALNLSGWREREFYGRSYRVKENITAEDLRKRLHLTLDHEVEVLEHQFTRNSVDTVRGTAVFSDPHTIDVEMEDGALHSYTGDKFILTVGTKPHRPSHIPFDGKTVFDSDEILDLDRMPRSLAVVGGGVIGVEYATIFSALDVPITLIEARETILDFVDQELVAELLHDLRDRGVVLRLGCTIKTVKKGRGRGCTITMENGRTVNCDMILFAAGRAGATDSLNLEVTGLQPDDRGRLIVDKNTFQTSVPHIYAAGDVIGFPSLASTSMEQGRIAACHALGEAAFEPPEFFPYGIYAVPEISTIGLSEEQVKEQGIPYEVGIARFRETSRGHIMGLNSGMMKMIVSLKTRKLLGVHIVGEGATELIHIGQAVLNLGGPLEYFVENTFNYPTLAEAYKIAALDVWNRMPPP